ncbi:ferric-dicitrate binding protein FerR, regulates iron transport through sigma-19 [Catalinimonas alkaloidigena]|uniref:Ferric-dicitrate binding protein FerR, regulates iron transport through sigma-19 n=1 Tax=Catalinimonas alkaloidigena TaxID=1075417 RepID=A0A1G9QIR6_9BACT|nr:FecR domain-containing protein [Catalinimonas alkaloidigena]SDM10195.1 ferric-dicitrate binding protein FerR, regulates iron transport through sigma-19 [Catalinimonas alkaloidigena]
MDPEHFDRDDLLADARFLQWVEGGDEALDQYWDAWMQRHPERRALVLETRRMLQSLRFPEHRLPESRVEARLQQIHRQIRQEGTAPRLRAAERMQPRRKRWMALAAACVALLVSVIGYLYQTSPALFTPEPLAYTTAYGETRTVTLPDGSTVVLNAHSSLTCASGWEATDDRDVWVKGEVFFSVRHTATDQKFIVHADSLQIEVLGTQFNVNNRRGGGEVVLTEGKVKVSDVRQTRQVEMHPGDLVAYAGGPQTLAQRKVDPEQYTAWRRQQLVFAATPLLDVAQTIEDTYGLRVVFADSALAARRFTGTIPTSDLDGLLVSLAETFDLTLERDATQVVYRLHE